MKNNKELLISFFDDKIEKNANGNYAIPRGTPLRIVPLYDVLFKEHGGLIVKDKALPKGHAGAIFAYIQDTLGIHSDGSSFSDGIIFIDIDKINKSECKIIYDAFNELIKKMPCILSCWYSNSYNDTTRDTGGLHFVIKAETDKTYGNDYRYFVELYGAILARVIHQCCDIDIRPRKDPDRGLDRVTKSIGQRFFLNQSEVKWNDNAYVIDPQFSDGEKEKLKEWVNEYLEWIKRPNEYKITNLQFNSIDLNTYNGGKINLGWRGRINLINSLYKWGVHPVKIEELLLKICGPKDWEGDKQKPGALLSSIKQSIRTAATQNPTAEQMDLAKETLKKVGIDVDMIIEKIYQPIDDKSLDNVFEEVWNDVKDKLPENYLHVHLEETEHLSDHDYEITPMILKHDCTYLKADCEVGKTYFSLDMTSQQRTLSLFEDTFAVLIQGDSVDLCVPYNSVADDKSKGQRKDIQRLKTQCLNDFNDKKRNVFIWNTIVPLYNKYSASGTVKRLVLFFDESQKLVTDEYRWKTVFDMFKVLPMMYKHFVFMTGTPAFEHIYLKQYFDNMCVINVTKDLKFKKTCNILKYNSFGDGDRITLIENEIANNNLPLIYSNVKNDSWKQALIKINIKRVEMGLPELRVLEYDRPSSDKLNTVNKTNSIKNYDVVITTKYCSVGVDFIKDDNRTRCSIIDYVGEKDCCFHDIWQFALRNRKQDMLIKVITLNNEAYNKKLYNYNWICNYCDKLAALHTQKINVDIDDETDSIGGLLNDIFKAKKFGKLASEGYFNNKNNVVLLASYYKYITLFRNINMIKHMMKLRGVDVIETDMEHAVDKLDTSYKNEIYKFFCDNFDTISRIRLDADIMTSNKITYKIPINDNKAEYIDGNKIYSRNTSYINWLIYNFAGKEEWKEVLLARDYMGKDTFAAYNKIKFIACKITKKEIKLINNIKNTLGPEMEEQIIKEIIKKHYNINIDDDKARDIIVITELYNDYKKIIDFMIDNIDYIEEVKNAMDEKGRIDATHKMKIAMEQKENSKRKKKISDTKTNTYTVKILKNGKIKTFNGQQEMADYCGVSKATICKFLNGEKNKVWNLLQLIDIE